MSNLLPEFYALDRHVEHNYVCLMAQLQRIDTQLQTRIRQLQQEADSAQDEWACNLEDTPPEELQSRLAPPPPALLDEEVAHSRLGQLVQRFGLTSLERDVLLLALLPHVNMSYLDWFAQAQGNSNMNHPTVQLVLDVLCPSRLEQVQHMASLLPDGALVRQGLLQLSHGSNNSSQVNSNTMIRADKRIYHYLIGHDYLPILLRQSCRWVTASHHLATTMTSSLAQLKKNLVPGACLVLKGLPDSGRAVLVAAAAQVLGMPVLEWDLAKLMGNDRVPPSLVTAIFCEVQLYAGCLILKHLPEQAEKRPELSVLLSLQADNYAQPVIILQGLSSPVYWLGDIPHKVLQLPARDLYQDRALLAQCLADIPLDDDVDLTSLAQRFPAVVSKIEPILQEAELYRRQRYPVGALSQADLHQAFRWRSQQNFGDLALRIEPKRSFDDLIVSAALQQHLAELRAAILHREHVLALGFGDKRHYGVGISALFYGASGTGKTMAAEVLADALRVDLIKVDLSTAVNKYIGETEKNLARIFDMAALDSGVLFFDEADALFGKRSEVKEAKDRHANIEVAYLLQRMEAHTGLVILSTNNRSHLDQAFSRRFTFILKFDYPDHATRVRLWQAVWPAQASLDDNINVEQLASMAELTGANISNIALAAAWLAVNEGAPRIGMSHIQHALKRELAKTGQLAR